jgi:hypothetical protein
MAIDAERLAKEAEEEKAREAEQYQREMEAKEEEAAELQYNQDIVGTPVRVQWGGGKSYVGRVTEFNEDDGKHKVEFTDGDVEWYNMREMEDRIMPVSEAELKPRRVQRGELSSVLPSPRW